MRGQPEFEVPPQAVAKPAASSTVWSRLGKRSKMPSRRVVVVTAVVSTSSAMTVPPDTPKKRGSGVDDVDNNRR
jgi:hypothetical protein